MRFGPRGLRRVRKVIKKSEIKELENIHKLLGDVYYTPMSDSGYWDKDSSIQVLGEEIRLSEISRTHVEKWYAEGSSSPFGNVSKQQTEYNDEVRSSREFDVTKFTVSNEILEDVADKWGDSFIPRCVKVQPYKVIIYGPGDHFQIHKDTPEENLCGTFLLSLYQDCKPDRPFQIRDQARSTITTHGGIHLIAKHGVLSTLMFLTA